MKDVLRSVFKMKSSKIFGTLCILLGAGLFYMMRIKGQDNHILSPSDTDTEQVTLTSLTSRNKNEDVLKQLIISQRREITKQKKTIRKQNQHILQLKQELRNLKQRPMEQQDVNLQVQHEQQLNDRNQRQQELFDYYNTIPVNIYTTSQQNNKWQIYPDICQNISVIQSAKLKTTAGSVDIFIHDPKSDIWVSGSLANGDSWESVLINLITSTLQAEKKADFLDIGANIGVYTLAAAKIGAKVIAVEPLKVNVQRLCTSVRAGNFTQNVSILRSAFSDVIESVQLGIDENNIGGSFVLKDKNINKVKESRVQGQYQDVVMTTKLDDLLQLPGFNLTRVVIKIDVEGYEHKVVKGGVTFFDKIEIPTVLMEWNFHKNLPSGSETVTFFQSRNYTCYDPIKNSILDSKDSNQWPHDIKWRRNIS